MKKEAKKPKVKSKPETKIRKTHPKIIITALAALGCVVLALFVWPWFILVAVVLWWMNKKYIKKHFGV
ncbi:MAG: hypothetical protein AABX96_05145 [Nanoarchaeota archaeon]